MTYSNRSESRSGARRSPGENPDRRLQFEILELRLQLAAFMSDDFNSLTLDPATWSFVDPHGDSSLELTGTGVQIAVSGGQNHDVWTAGNAAPRLMQSISDTDFELEAKFESVPTGANAISGLVVESASGDFIRFDFTSNSSGLRVFAASSVSGSVTTHYSQPISASVPLFLRMTRSGDNWDQSYSTDGTNWSQGASFVLPFAVSSAGVFAGNSGGSSAPAFVSSVDYVFNTSSPIDPEDADLSLDNTAPVISDLQPDAPTEVLTVTFVTDDPSIGTVRYGTTSQYELGSISGSVLTESHSIQVPGLQPLTTYQFEVSAANFNGLTTDTGNLFVRTGAPSGQLAPVIDVWYGTDPSFGDPGDPQRWANILGRVWDSDGVQSLDYSLNGGPSNPLSIGPNGSRLESSGDFNIDIDRALLDAGSNTVILTAVDTLGTVSMETITLTYEPDRVWPHSYAIDWSGVADIADVADVVDGHWMLTADGIRTLETGYDRLVNFGNIHMPDFEVEVPVTIHGVDNDGNFGPPGVGIVARWAGHIEDPFQPHIRWYPLGGLGWYRSGRLEIIGNDTAYLATGGNQQLDFDVPYIFKFRVESATSGPATYRLKVWEQGTTEPAGWDLVGLGVAGELDAGSVLLVAHHTDATFGNVSITPISDGVPPAVNINLQANAASIGVSATSDIPATWEVSYGLTSNFELGTLRVATPSNAEQWTLSGLDSNTQYYIQVAATDTNGDASSPQVFTVTTLPPDTTPPTIVGLQHVAGATEVDVTVTTDESTSLVIQYGLTSSYELGSVASPMSLQHDVRINGLTPETLYYLRIVATDDSGNSSTPSDLTVTTTSPVEVASDGFTDPVLDPSLWNLVDPLGDAAVTVDNGRLVLSIPGGIDHDIWNSGITAPRLMQAVSDVDFQVEMKFDTQPTGQFAIQGLVVETAAGELLRFDFYSSNSGVHLFAGVTDGVTASAKYNKPVSIQQGQSLYLRVTRSGSQWTQEYSTDGLNWTVGGSYIQNAVVTGVGLYAGNAGGSAAPPVSVEIDHFENTAEPLPDFDPPILTNVSTTEDESSIAVSGVTDEPATLSVAYGLTTAYELGVAVGDPASIAHSVSIEGLSAGTTYYLRVQATDPSGNVSTPQDIVTATEPPDLTPPVLSNVVANPTATTISVTASTDELATLEVRYGLTTNYELGSVVGAEVGTQHDVRLTSLTPETSYELQVVAIDESGNVSAAQNFTLATTAPIEVTSDGFDDPGLNTLLWEFVNPVGDSTASLQNQHLQLVVPGGTSHDLWTNNRLAPRVLQDVSDIDFDVETRFSTQPAGQYAMSGIIVQEDEDNLVRFDFYSANSGIYVFAATFTGGTASVRHNVKITPPVGAPLYMRVGRTGDQWVQEYSFDGINWQAAANFSHSLAVTAVGPFAGNAGGSSAPAHTALVDYFQNSDSPVPDTTPPVLTDVSASTPTTSDIVVDGTTDELATMTVQYGLTDSYELGTIVGGSGLTAHSVQITGLSADTAYYVRVSASDPSGNATAPQDLIVATPPPDVTPPILSDVSSSPGDTSIVVAATTNELATVQVLYGETPQFEIGSVSTSQFADDHEISVLDLAPETTYYLRLLATDESGNVSAGYDMTVTTVASTAIATDDFSGSTLDTSVWTAVDPVGDGVVSVGNGALTLDVPGGVNHDAWTAGLDAVRVMQTVSDMDFEIEVKFESQPSGTYAMQGVLVEDGLGDFVRFDFYSSGSDVRVFAATVQSGSATIRHNSSIGVGPGLPLYLRVRRIGDQWTQEFSTDGASWVAAADFNHAINVAQVGLFAGNMGNGSSPAPANTVVVDYFNNTASAPQDTDPPVITASSADASGPDSLLVTATTSEPATVEVRYGLTTSYELGTIQQSQLLNQHSVPIGGLSPGTTYFVQIIATDLSGNSSTPESLSVATPAAQTLTSDEFTGPSLDTTIWTFVDPCGDGSVNLVNGSVEVSVPGGKSHDAWTSGVDAPRIMQSTGNVDFEIEVKFDSQPVGQYAMNGLLVQGAAGDFIRFDYFSSSRGLNIFAAYIGGTTDMDSQSLPAATGSSYLRIARAGDVWTFRYSMDGQNWVIASQMTHAMDVNAVGVFAGNAGGGSAPAYTSSVDYFRTL